MKDLYNYVKIGSWNMEGAYFKTGNYYTNKLHEPEFLNTVQTHDILCIQETHCGPNDIPSQHLKNYYPIPHCRGKSANNRYFGGMLLLIKKNIRQGIKISSTDDPDILGITLKKDFFSLPEDTQIWFTYASPSTSPYSKGRENVLAKLETYMAAYGNHQLVMGDLNGRTATDADYIEENYDSFSPLHDIDHYEADSPLMRNNMDKTSTDTHGKTILNICKNLQLRILNGRTAGDRWGVPTRYPVHKKEKPSVIDYGICSAKALPRVNSFYVLPYTILSDHCCLSLSLSTRHCGSVANENETSSDSMKEETKYPKFKLEFMKTYHDNLEQDESFVNLVAAINATKDKSVPTQADIDQLVENFQKPIMENAQKSFLARNIKPRKTNKTRVHKPAKWYSNKCLQAKNSLKRASKQLNKNPFSSHYQELFIAAKKTYKRTCKQAESQARQKLLDKLLQVEDPKEFWNMINDMKRWGREKVDPCDTIPPHEWEDHFKNLLNTGNTQQRAKPIPANSLNPRMDRKIVEDELNAVLSRSKIGKARGPDGTLAEYFKYAPSNVRKALLHLMNLIFSTAIYPTSWTINFLKAIYKSGPTSDPGNYRGLAIGSAIAKLYSAILLNRLEAFVTEENIMSICQIGFRKLFRTADHIYVLKTIVNIKISKGEKLYAAFIDFRKAYDTVNRQKLLDSLQIIGVGSKFAENIKAIYEKVQYTIKVKGKLMDPILSNLGLKQGCPLSPLLFNLYINDIAKYLNRNCREPNIKLQGIEITHFLYADDLVVISPTRKGLQEKLDNLSLFAKDKDLTINTKKSQVMIFNKGGKLLKDQFSIDGNNLEVVPSYTYLGIDIPTNGSFNPGMAQMNSKAKKAMMPLYTTIMQFNIPFQKALKLFQTYVEPILLYNAENFAAMSERQVEKCKQGTTNVYDLAMQSSMTTTQLKFIKFILGVGKQTPNMAVLGEAAVLPLLMRAHIAMLKFWNRIRNMEDNTLVKLAYKENLETNSTWCKTIQILNTSFNLHTRDWSPAEFAYTLKKKIKTAFITYWKTRIRNPDVEKKLGLYAKVKKEFSTDAYLEMLSFKSRQIITKFLSSNHRLRIETGRHTNPKIPRDERLCQLCDLSKVEDECHFILECPTYDSIRRDSPIKFENYASPEPIFHLEEPIILADFLRKAYDKRDQLTTEPPETYQVIERSKDGLKLSLFKGKGPPGQLRVKNITKDGLKLKIYKTSNNTPFGTQSN